jgi:predicted flavoprotein YhiN
MPDETTPDESMPGGRPSHVVVVGAGWAGWGAAKALCEAGIRVTLIDGMPDPTGSTPITTKSGKPFQAPEVFGKTIQTSTPSQMISVLAISSLTSQPVPSGLPMG